MNPLGLKHYRDACRNIDRLGPRAMRTLHPELRARLHAVLDELGGRLAVWQGYRGKYMQNAARAKGFSEVGFGDSPHNYKPSLAVDVVLDPRHVLVDRSPSDREWPWLWDDKSADAIAAWEALHRAARKHHLHRVRVNGKLDRPHLELPGWRNYVNR